MNRLRRTILISIAVLLASIAPATGFAAGTHVWSSPITATFHLHVQGRVSTGTTFWVAYGPLAGRWGIVRLHAMRAGLYEADALLPTGRTTIAYIQGHGLLHTRMGPVPGNPVITIQRIGPMPISRAILQTVQWQMPVG